MTFVYGSGIIATAGFSKCTRPSPLVLPCWLCTSLLLVLNESDTSGNKYFESKEVSFVTLEMSEEVKTRNDIEIKLDTTLALIKPDAIHRVIEIEDAILRAGFVILQKRRLKLSPEKASEFYEEHLSKSFFPDLISFMSSGPIVALLLTKKDAVKEWRNLIGPTNSEKARETRPDCLRARFGTDGQRNALHGSDSNSSALREIRFFFPNAVLETRPLHKMEEYLDGVVRSTLVKGLASLCRNKPLNPTVWLADWLVNNNPNKPRIEEAGF